MNKIFPIVLLAISIYFVSTNIQTTNNKKYSETKNLINNQTTNISQNFKNCKSCHGVYFEKKALSTSKVVQEMTEKEIINALIGYKNGTYGGPFKSIMQNQLQPYTIEELINFKINR